MANALEVATWLDVWERAAASTPAARTTTLLEPWLSGAEPPSLLGRRDALLLDLRGALFGSRLRSTSICPACRECCEWDCDLDALRAAERPAATGCVDIIEGEWRIRARAVTAEDLVPLAGCADEHAALRALLRSCVLEARKGDRTVDAAELPGHCVERVSEALAGADPQAALSVALSCPACAHGFDAAFDLGEYLWTELDAWAQRTLADVHELASRYGWSEPQILALSPARRARYLAMGAA